MNTIPEMIIKEIDKIALSLYNPWSEKDEYNAFVSGCKSGYSLQSEQKGMRWVKAGDYVPNEPDLKQWRSSETKEPALWHQIKRIAVSEDRSDEVEWLNESAPPEHIEGKAAEPVSDAIEFRKALEEIIQIGKDWEWGEEFWEAIIANKALKQSPAKREDSNNNSL